MPHWYSASRQSFGIYKESSEPSVTVQTRELPLLMCCEGCYRHGCNRSIIMGALASACTISPDYVQKPKP